MWSDCRADFRTMLTARSAFAATVVLLLGMAAWPGVIEAQSAASPDTDPSTSRVDTGWDLYAIDIVNALSGTDTAAATPRSLVLAAPGAQSGEVQGTATEPPHQLRPRGAAVARPKVAADGEGQRVFAQAVESSQQHPPLIGGQHVLLWRRGWV